MADPQATVSIVRLERYEPSAVREALEKLLSHLGGPAAFFPPGSSVVLKPNFLRPADAASALTTHPEVIRAAAALAKSQNAREVSVTDSPGIGTATRCAKKLGLELSGPDFNVIDADDPVDCETTENLFRKIRVSKRIRDAEVLINLAKVKTHAQMGMTLAVKNTFGAVIGSDKGQWHFRAGRDPLRFAELIVRIHERISPTLNVVDGVVGMEGNGPGSGDPRSLGFLAASTDAHALDLIVCKALGVDPAHVYTLRVARSLGLCPEERDIRVVGDSISRFKPTPPWRLARPVSTRMLGTRLISPILERLLTVSPVIDAARCTLCMRCVECCAASALTKKAGGTHGLGRIHLDHKRCISCFCCQEMCPEGAISVKSSYWGKKLRLGVR